MIVALLAAPLWGCGNVESGKNTRIEEAVGPAGQTLVFDKLAVDVPEGALDSEGRMVIYLTADHPDGNVGPVYGIRLKLEGEWQGHDFTFAKPVELTYQLPEAEAASLGEYDDLRLARVDNGQWTLLETTAAIPAAELITGAITTPGVFGIISGPPCEPECEDKNCGDDGCGGVCGECTGPQDECQDGLCTCLPHCEGKECGEDGCGGVCGECAEGNSCNEDGLCQPDDPNCGEDYANLPCYFSPCDVPSFSICLITECGTVGATEGKLNLGGVHDLDADAEGVQVEVLLRVCKMPEDEAAELWFDGEVAETMDLPAGTGAFAFLDALTLMGGAEPQCFDLKVTVGDAPDLEKQLCTDVCVPQCEGKECGEDGCGGECACAGENEVCIDEQCICMPDCSCDGGGEIWCTTDDGCGGLCPGLNDECPGAPCDGADPCGDPQCPEADCGSKECGPDGIGGSCGDCAPAEVCFQGQCTDSCDDESFQSCCENNVAVWCDSGKVMKWDCSAPSYPEGPSCSELTTLEATAGFYQCNTAGALPRCQLLPTDPCDGLTIDTGDETNYCTECVGNCADKECGNDGCGNLCGVCPDGETCAPHGKCVVDVCYGQCCGEGCDELNQYCEIPNGSQSCGEQTCENICLPDCAGKECGSSNCPGGHCGLCKPGEACIEGVCQSCD